MVLVRTPTGAPVGEPSAARLTVVPAAPPEQDRRAEAVPHEHADLDGQRGLVGRPVRHEPPDVLAELPQERSHGASLGQRPARRMLGTCASGCHTRRMQTDPHRGLRAVGFLLVAVGALVAGIGALTAWVEVGLAGSTARVITPEELGVDRPEGVAVLALAAVALVAALVSRVGRTSARGRAAMVSAIAGLAIVAICAGTLALGTRRLEEATIATCRRRRSRRSPPTRRADPRDRGPARGPVPLGAVAVAGGRGGGRGRWGRHGRVEPPGPSFGPAASRPLARGQRPSRPQAIS